MFKVEIYRNIYDGQTHDDSTKWAATMISLELPFPPSLDIEVLHSEKGIHGTLASIKWVCEREVFQCSLNDYFGLTNIDSFNFEGMIARDTDYGWTLVTNQNLV